MRFKQRHNIQQHIQQGEAGSVPAEAAEEMKAIQTLCGEYPEDDVYNMDESGLFWRMAVSTGVSTQSMPGVKKNKSKRYAEQGHSVFNSIGEGYYGR
jgi:hypothetical protein